MKLFGFNITRHKSHDSHISHGKAFDPQVWLTGADISDQSEGAKLVTPYAQSAWVYIAVRTLAENISQIPFRISRISGSAQKEIRGWSATRHAGRAPSTRHLRVLEENEVESGPVIDLFNQPHKTMDRALFWSSICTWEALRGEFFIMPLDSAGDPVDLQSTLRSARLSHHVSRFTSSSPSPVASMLTVAPELFWHMVQGYDLVAWRYTGSMLVSPIASQILSPSEVIHSRSPNPYLYWRGLSPITLAMLPAQADYAAEQFMKGLMMNNADTGVIITTDQQVSAEQREAIMAALRERKRKAGTPDRPLFLWGGAKLDKPAISSADMQFLENRKLSRQEICSIFGVPETMLGFTDRTRSLGGGGEMEQEKLNFIENKIVPHCRRYEAALEPIIKSFDPDLVGYFDVDDLPILQNARRLRLDAAGKAFGMGVPFNQINNAYDLGFEEIQSGDIGYLPFNLTPAESVANPPEPAPAPPADPNAPPAPAGPEPSDPMMQDHVSRASDFFSRFTFHVSDAPTHHASGITHTCRANPEYDATLRGSIRLKKSKTSRFFFEQRARILENLPRIMKEFAHISDDSHSSHWLWQPRSELSRGLDDLFDPKSEDSKLTQKLKPLFLDDLAFGGAQLFGEINLDPATFSLAPADAIAFLDKRASAISGINQTTWDSLRSSLQAGLANGDTMQELQDRVKLVYSAFTDARAETIAVTETNIAVQSGRHQAMLDAGVERKGWQTSHLENTRATHIANEALSNEQNGIPIDDTWPNGCSYPGDPDGDPGEVINCRCFGFAIIPGAASITASPLTYDGWRSLRASHAP